MTDLLDAHSNAFGRNPVWIAPKFSRSRVDQAGRRIRSGQENLEDTVIFENWRLSHAYVLNAFQFVLRRRLRDFPNAAFAQRHKRKTTIKDKLLRQPNMALSRMHDIAGCRLIFPNTIELYKYRNELHTSRWAHERTNEIDDFDYIKGPKFDGYRGVHDVYKYHSRASSSQFWDGMRIEIQYRTIVQHSWATTVEIADSLMKVGAKFGKAPTDHIDFFSKISHLFFHVIEDNCNSISSSELSELQRDVFELNRSTNIMLQLRGLSAVRDKLDGYKHVVLEIDGASRDLKVYRSKTAREATQILVDRERSADMFRDVVLVSADSSQGLRSAFRNYFSDAEEFVQNFDRAMNFRM